MNKSLTVFHRGETQADDYDRGTKFSIEKGGVLVVAENANDIGGYAPNFWSKVEHKKQRERTGAITPLISPS